MDTSNAFAQLAGIKGGVPTTPSAPSTPPQSLSDSIWGAIGKPIGNAIQSGADQLQSGFNQPKTVAGAAQGGLNIASGLATGAGAIFAPLLQSLSEGLSKALSQGSLLDSLTNDPGFQKFAGSPHGQTFATAVQNVGKLANVAGATTGFEAGVNEIQNPTVKAPTIENTKTLGNNTITPEAGQVDPTTARTQAWNDIQPPATEDTIKAYRAQGNTTSRGTFKSTGLLPSTADKGVLDVVQPLYENGTLKPEMTAEQKLATLDNVSKQLTQQSDAYVNDHNVTSSVSDLKDDLNIAKNNSDVIFAGSKTLETAYDTVVQNYLDKLKITPGASEGLGTIDATTGETVPGTPETPEQTTSIAKRDALKQFDAEMRQKFPNAYKTKTTGELNPTDNARYNAIRDVHSTVQDNIKADMGDNSPYSDLLNRNSKIITAKSMVNENAATVSKIATYLKSHPLQARLANRVVLGTAGGLFMAGLGIYALRSQLSAAVKQLANGL